MTDDPPVIPTTSSVHVEANRMITVPIDQIVIGAGRCPINDVTGSKFQKRIGLLGLLSPLLVARPEDQDGREVYQLVAGWNRLQAMKLRGVVDAPCIVLERGGDLHVELAAIDENFTPNDPTPAEHALLTGRRREIFRRLGVQDGSASQDAIASRQAKRCAGQKTGPDAASVRDQANRTGESKDKIQRSINRFETLGSPILERIIGTSLDKGAELDALMKLPEAVRDDCAPRRREEEVTM